VAGQTNASFVGWGPVDDPKFIVYIWLEKPQSSIWSSVVVAPVFSEIVENLVILMDIPPDKIRMEMASSQ
jgi:cell division protein FtsI/penicillin-binding protein 2